MVKSFTSVRDRRDCSCDINGIVFDDHCSYSIIAKYKTSPFRNPLAQMEEEKREHELKVKKMEAEMEQVFEMKVKEKKNKLKESEADVS